MSELATVYIALGLGMVTIGVIKERDSYKGGAWELVSVITGVALWPLFLVLALLQR